VLPNAAIAQEQTGQDQFNPLAGATINTGTGNVDVNIGEAMQRSAPGPLHAALAQGGTRAGMAAYDAANQAGTPFPAGEREVFTNALLLRAYSEARQALTPH